MNTKQNIIIIGNGMVGHKFVEKFLAQAEPGRFNLVVFGEEPRPAYDRVHLSEFFAGKTAADLQLASREWYTAQGVTLYTGEPVTEINPAAKTITTATGRVQSYDKLVLATGSAPFVPNLPGINLPGVFVYRTIEDLEAIQAYSQKCQTGLVIGGGLLGLEAAKALLDLKFKTHVVEMAPRLMPRQIDQTGSEVLERKIETLDITIHTGKNTQAIVGPECVTALAFADGTELPVEMIVVSAGIKPRDELAQQAGLTIGERGGIVVNDHLQTSDPHIYAIGECALHGNMIYGLVAPGYRMAESAINHLLTRPGLGFTGADMSTKLKLLGVDVASIGHSLANGRSHEAVIFTDSRQGVYKKLIISPESNTLKGAILVGDTQEYGQLLQMYLNQMPLPTKPENLIVKGSGASETAGVEGLPDTAQICSCENVCKSHLLQAIADGHHTVGNLKACTKAGTGCGSCVPLVKDLLTHELEKAGVTVDKSLCEHFAYTRQELMQIIKVAQIKTFAELLGRYGIGEGCEICKPAVASILASTWNEYVLEHQPIQDTNDYFLANIQKNGSYSVVPRIPGGEITPAQLIAIGQIAADFNLYTKITGGQRIDLFGARVEDLPEIWSRLREHGLESGHAYAKALRTVKSCVGSAWCRFGVQDSTTMAIEIENRYKGLRAPHKIKMAVSGCARECAEAQSKDIGVIATENGWNLYVCGNGGMKPQHAKLFATDLDDHTLITYIDRILMYYVRTADRLTRTATWLNKLPGGLEHLQQVVMQDSLGICADLDAEMALVIDTYECEWSRTLNDPAVLQRFRPFVNTAAPDPSIQMQEVRGQLIPLTVIQ